MIDPSCQHCLDGSLIETEWENSAFRPGGSRWCVFCGRRGARSAAPIIVREATAEDLANDREYEENV